MKFEKFGSFRDRFIILGMKINRGSYEWSLSINLICSFRLKRAFKFESSSWSSAEYRGYYFTDSFRLFNIGYELILRRITDLEAKDDFIGDESSGLFS